MVEDLHRQRAAIPAAAFDEVEAIVASERRRLTDERDAFEGFVDEVRGIDPRVPDRSTAIASDRPSQTGLDRVRDAYVRTVMAVPHYHEEYGESLEANVAEELGDGVAAGLTTGATLSPYLKRAILEAGRRAIASREDVLETVEAEAEAVERTADRIASIVEELRSALEQPLERAEFNTLRVTRERLGSLRDRALALAAERQATLRAHTRSIPLDVEDFGAYIYDECETIHPLVSRIAAIVDLIEDAVDRIEDRLARAS